MKKHIFISFKKELLEGKHSINDDFYICLIDDKKEVSKNFTSYFQIKNELKESSSYAKGGKKLIAPRIVCSSNSASITFDPIMWENSNISAKGAIIYNNSRPNKSLMAVVIFDEVCFVEYGDFVIDFNEDGFIGVE